MENDFRVGAGGESVAILDELFAQFQIIEDLAIKRYAEVSVATLHRLPAAAYVDYAEPGVRETGPL
jgi:hypothetical protein